MSCCQPMIQVSFWCGCLKAIKVDNVVVTLLSKILLFFQVTVKTDDMDLAGDIIQALASFLGIEVDMLPNKKLHLVTYIFYFMKFLCRCVSVQ